MNRIDYLIQRYLERKETKDELRELMELIASGHYQEDIENRFAEQLVNRMPEAGRPPDASIQDELQAVRNRIKLPEANTGKGKVVKMYMKAPWFRAAAAVLLVAVSYVSWQYGMPVFEAPGAPAAQVSSVTSSGSIAKVILADGTLVWLKGSSTITYPPAFTGATRNVSLQGEALFEVAKDSSHPFVIQCGELTTTVLGTSFNIKAFEGDVEVVVLTGKVSLSSRGNEEDMVVLPNEKALYSASKKQLAKIDTAAGEEEAVAVVEGTEYSMTFEDTRMDEIARRVESKFNVQVSFADARLGNCMITANLTDQSLDNTLTLIAKALSIEYEVEGTRIILSGAGCD